MPDDLKSSPGDTGRPRRTHRLRWVTVLLTPIALIALYMVIVLNWSYSTGERAGYVQKFSQKGWLCKTWEGELAMVNLPGTMPEKFQFSVHSDSVASLIRSAIQTGKRTALVYHQHKGIPTSCFGETEYWVTDVQIAGP